jgi:hypothetical protein
MNTENERLSEIRQAQIPWKRWGPYLSERQWGTVREDYSLSGDAWNYFPHDQARSRAYRWGEDGLAGISDDNQQLCFALALWNEKDPILKERLFGLNNSEANHGEDVKEYYFYLDNTPTHAYMKYLYKYPQASFPYEDLVRTNQQRSRDEMEYELLDTGVFDEDRYFDVFVEYAKGSPEDILIRITIHNRGSEAASVHVLPTLWFRNTWSWSEAATKPMMKLDRGSKGVSVAAASHSTLGERYLYCAAEPPLLFTENETNHERISGSPDSNPYVKDGINNFVVAGMAEAVNPEQTGTKASAHYPLSLKPGESRTIRLRLTDISPAGFEQTAAAPFGDQFDRLFQLRVEEADKFYRGITPDNLPADAKMVMRQALAGMLWTKQFYHYDLWKWVQEHGIKDATSFQNTPLRNKHWYHMVNANIISMPDKWEYPWYAAWDLAFHTISLAIIDIDFAKEQLALMLDANYLHPNGQIPAYEWNFSDVNPPVHAWALGTLYQIEKEMHGQGDVEFLQDAFHNLMLNFTWWVNRKDTSGKNVFQGGFLGLDNIGVFDRSAPLPTGGHLEQADGTAWMAFFALSMMNIALELCLHDPSYQGMAIKFLEHFLWINSAMNRFGGQVDDLWDETDGFFYDVISLPDGRATRLKVRSLVGLLPIAACAIVSPEMVQKLPVFMERVRWLEQNRPELTQRIPSIEEPGVNNRRLLAVLDEGKLRRVLSRMLDESEFFGSYGIRSISRVHRDHPYVLNIGGTEYRVDYLPAESNTGMFGGNSNWRGPVWFPMNFILLRGLVTMHAYYGDEFTIECPTGSGQQMTLWEISQVLAVRLAKIFLRDSQGRRPVYGSTEKFQVDPHWKDHLLFYEYFHGDNGAGLGASHQTGWTGLVARIIQIYGLVTDFESDIKFFT